MVYKGETHRKWRRKRLSWRTINSPTVCWVNCLIRSPLSSQGHEHGVRVRPPHHRGDLFRHTLLGPGLPRQCAQSLPGNTAMGTALSPLHAKLAGIAIPASRHFPSFSATVNVCIGPKCCVCHIVEIDSDHIKNDGPQCELAPRLVHRLIFPKSSFLNHLEKRTVHRWK